MKWIKGKPKDVDSVIMRRISNLLLVITEIYEYDHIFLDTGKEIIYWSDVEYLDESTPNNSGFTLEDMEQCHMAGQRDAGCKEPSYSDAKAYVNDVSTKPNS